MKNIYGCNEAQAEMLAKHLLINLSRIQRGEPPIYSVVTTDCNPLRILTEKLAALVSEEVAV